MKYVYKVAELHQCLYQSVGKKLLIVVNGGWFIVHGVWFMVGYI